MTDPRSALVIDDDEWVCRLLAVAMLASLPEIYDVPHAALFAL